MVNPYYTHPYLSNSDLTKLRNEISGADHIEYKAAFRRGTVLDAFITQKEIIPELELSKQEYDFGKRGLSIFLADPLCRELLNFSKTQEPFYEQGVKFKYANIEFTYNCKCLYDGIFKGVMGWDVKHTIAKTEAAFIQAIYHFQYTRSRAWYMNLSGLKNDMIIGINVKDKLLFKVPIIIGGKNHVMYELGKRQYSELAYQHWVLR